MRYYYSTFFALWMCCVVLLPMHAQSQRNDFVPESWVGVQGGATGSMVWFLPSVNQTYLLGYHGGISFRHISEKHLGLHVELNLTQRGFKELNGQFSRRFDYVELPFLSHIYFGRTVQFFFQVGPKLGYLLNDQVVINHTGDTTAPQRTLPVTNKFDYGFSAGLGMSIPIAKQLVQLYTRANFSANNLFPATINDPFSQSNSINLSLSLSWMMPVK